MLIIPGVIASSYPKASGAFESIASATGTGSSATITFTSIPSTYQSLQLRYIARSTEASASTNFQIRLNNDSGNNYADHNLDGNGATVSAGGGASVGEIDLGRVAGGSATADIVGVGIVDIHDYASTTRNKTIRTFSGNDRNGAGNVYLFSGLWMNTAAVNRLDIFVTGGSLSTITSIALYGIKGA